MKIQKRHTVLNSHLAFPVRSKILINSTESVEAGAIIMSVFIPTEGVLSGCSSFRGATNLPYIYSNAIECAAAA